MLADEYDAAQERGEVAKGRPKSVADGDTFQATAADIGLSRNDIHEARIVSDAEQSERGPLCIGWKACRALLPGDLPWPQPTPILLEELRPTADVPAARSKRPGIDPALFVCGGRGDHGATTSSSSAELGRCF